MAQITCIEAARQAIVEEMRSDPRVFVMGEDVQSYFYADVLEEFGRARIRNTPISECGFFGAGIGAALTGMRPVIEGAYSTFLYSAMDQIANQAAKSRYMFGGQANIPIVIRSLVWYNGALAAHHSDRPWGIFAQVPGLKIVVPTTPREAKGLMKSALRDGNPVLWFEDVAVSAASGEVPEGDYTIPLGTADIKRSGCDVTVAALGGAVNQALSAAQALEPDGISLEVIDIRSVVPLDRQTIIDSVARTGRLIAVDPAPGTCSVASEIASMVAEQAFDFLRAPVAKLTAPNVPVPFSPDLERLMYPTAEQIVTTARRLLTRRH